MKAGTQYLLEAIDSEHAQATCGLFANKPMILHQTESLKAVGVTEVILAINYQPQVHWLLPRRSCSGSLTSPFFMLNSDIISEYPLKEMRSFHQARSW
ncbi:hypothetical protein OPV22_014607 [Ensete ventricosum]|uniref:Uncharacterized protein n=1 Tax=Ensete ventricosum TaxID=4639 RepID=A0AAV8RC97_ENSVE|nr:hypothetical protein OPV22_014607 [Ensete ventricosum]